MLKWSNLEFTFEVGGSLVALDAMFLEPCHAVIHAKILTGINRENFAVKNKYIQEREVKDPKLSTPPPPTELFYSPFSLSPP